MLSKGCGIKIADLIDDIYSRGGSGAMKDKLIGKKIAVIMGGRSAEREVSLRTGKNIYGSLIRQGFNAIAVDMVNGNILSDLKKEKIDLVFIALHGKYGEDGTVQGLLETLDIPYTGSGVLSSALAMNKIMAKKLFISNHIPTPPYLIKERDESDEDFLKRCEEIFDFPMMVKPVAEGSSVGVHLVRRRDELGKAYGEVSTHFRYVFIENYIPGRELTVGILGVGEKQRALPVIELVPKKDFYDYEAKYTKGMTEFFIPAHIPPDLYRESQRIALAAHNTLGCQGVSRVDMILSDEGTPYVLDVNTIPGMTETSDLPLAAEADGISFDELVSELLFTAFAPKI